VHGVEGVVVGELVSGRDVAQGLQLGPPVAPPRDACLDHHVGLAAVVHPASLIDHVEEHAVVEHERPRVVARLSGPPQHALDVGDHGALAEPARRHHAEAVDRRADDLQTGDPRHQPPLTRFFAASSR
jgi:hypothetical protein